MSGTKPLGAAIEQDPKRKQEIEDYIVRWRAERDKLDGQIAQKAAELVALS
ncbi:MAG: hypothetical protein HOK54_15915 [Alphaproteobacteria bacterium]|jgi:hypothetical protein|nr:hypothetical protein [Alphaproteobacteria bacterium]